MPDLSNITKKTDKSIELEVVQLDKNGKLAGRKRYWSLYKFQPLNITHLAKKMA